MKADPGDLVARVDLSKRMTGREPTPAERRKAEAALTQADAMPVARKALPLH